MQQGVQRGDHLVRLAAAGPSRSSLHDDWQSGRSCVHFTVRSAALGSFRELRLRDLRQRGRILQGARHHGGCQGRPPYLRQPQPLQSATGPPIRLRHLASASTLHFDPDPSSRWGHRRVAQYWIAETAKRRLIFGLDELQLPVKVSDGISGLGFDLLSSSQGRS